MQRLLIENIKMNIDTTQRVKGWIKTLRKLGKVMFLVVYDATGSVQVVVDAKDHIDMLKGCHPGTVVDVSGKIVASEQKSIGCEIICSSISLLSKVDVPPPIEYYRKDIPSDMSHILDNRAISLRNEKIRAVFLVQHSLVEAYRIFMSNEVKAKEFFGPNMIASSSEGGAEFFTVDYFTHKATLAQSSQLYKQIMVGVFEKVFAVVPFFRAEPSQTTRHLSEGKQFEFEMGFFDDWKEILDVQENVLRAMISHVNLKCSDELDLLDVKLPQFPKEGKIPQYTFHEALDISFKETGIDERNEDDLSPHVEKTVCAYVKKKTGSDFVFITDWLREKRPFYSYPSDDSKELTNTFDLLCKGVEITSGGQRRHQYDSMKEGIIEKGMDTESFHEYLSIFKAGMPPHGGFGMGLERVTMLFLGLDNIRHASLFPSCTKRVASSRLKKNVVKGKENIEKAIIALLKSRSISPKICMPETVDINATLLVGKKTGTFFLFICKTSAKIDMKKAAVLVQEKVTFEREEKIKDIFGISPFYTPPFGDILGVATYIDLKILNTEDVVTLRTGNDSNAVALKFSECLELIDGIESDFVKEEL